MSQVIRKASREKENALMDEFLAQHQNERPLEELSPLEPNQQVMDRLKALMDAHLAIKEKKKTLSAIAKVVNAQDRAVTKDLTTLMKLYGLAELVKGKHKFSLEPMTTKSSIVAKTKREDLKDILSMVMGDREKAEKACQLVDLATKETVKEKLTCVDHDGS